MDKENNKSKKDIKNENIKDNNDNNEIIEIPDWDLEPPLEENKERGEL